MLIRRFAWIFSPVFMLLFAVQADSQQITSGTPFHALNDGYYERYGIGWTVNWPGGFARFGVPNQAIPPYGKSDPSGGFQTGWQFGNRNFHGNVFLSAAQGSTRSYSSQSPFVTVTNGYPGGFYDLSLSPFVTGIIPVVGDYPAFGPMMQNVEPQLNSDSSPSLDRAQVMRRLMESQKWGEGSSNAESDPGKAMLPRHAAGGNIFGQISPSNKKSTADTPAPSVAEAKRLFEQEKEVVDDEISALFARAEAAEASGRPGLAKIYYQMIVRRTQGELKRTAQQRLKEL